MISSDVTAKLRGGTEPAGTTINLNVNAKASIPWVAWAVRDSRSTRSAWKTSLECSRSRSIVIGCRPC